MRLLLTLCFVVAIVCAKKSDKDETEVACKVDKDCPMQPFWTCDSKSLLCVHKGVFPPYASEYVGILVLPILLAFANVGGIGGGGLIVPITMALFQFTMKSSIVISGFTIFTGAVVRFFYQWNNKHPKKNSTIIEYNIVIVMMPMVLVGSFVGVLLNIYLPSLVLAIILLSLLLFLTF
jgi:hypothetical protein